MQRRVPQYFGSLKMNAGLAISPWNAVQTNQNQQLSSQLRPPPGRYSPCMSLTCFSVSNPFGNEPSLSIPTVSEPAKQIFLFFSRFFILFYDVIALSASASNHVWPNARGLRINPLLQLKIDLQKRMSFGGNFAVEHCYAF